MSLNHGSFWNMCGEKHCCGWMLKQDMYHNKPRKNVSVSYLEAFKWGIASLKKNLVDMPESNVHTRPPRPKVFSCSTNVYTFHMYRIINHANISNLCIFFVWITIVVNFWQLQLNELILLALVSSLYLVIKIYAILIICNHFLCTHLSSVSN